MRAAEGSSRGSRREATGSFGWNTLMMGMRSRAWMSGDDANDDVTFAAVAATAAAGAGCVCANGLNRFRKVTSSCCRGRNIPRGEPMQMRH